jgi:hypothetical protein
MNSAHASDGRDFLGVGLNPSLRDNEAEEHARGTPKTHFFRVQLDAFSSKASEGFI